MLAKGTIMSEQEHIQLLTQELRASLPPLYGQDGNKNPFVHAKFFTPDAGWTWLITEGSPEGEDFIFFGYVIGLEEEWGYISLAELESARGPLKLPLERDLYFESGPWSEVIARHRKERGEQA
jgi:hypothetical protein